MAWARNYGKGRVLYNGMGHQIEVWDRPDIQKMWLEMVQWSMGMVPGDATPRPLPAQGNPVSRSSKRRGVLEHAESPSRGRVGLTARGCGFTTW